MASITLPNGVTVQCDIEDHDWIAERPWHVFTRESASVDLSQIVRSKRIYLLREIAFRIDPRLRALEAILRVFAKDGDRTNVRRENVDIRFLRPKTGRTARFSAGCEVPLWTQEDRPRKKRRKRTFAPGIYRPSLTPDWSGARRYSGDDE